MATNGTEVVFETGREEELRRLGRRGPDTRASEAPYPRPAGAPDAESIDDFALAPLVNKIAQGIAKGLVVAMKELEDHIAGETRKLGDAVDRRLDVLQTGMRDLTGFVTEQRATNNAVQGELQQLVTGLHESDARQTAGFETVRKDAQEFASTVSQRIDAATASLQEADARHAAELAALQDQTGALSQSVAERIDSLCRELGVHQEDLSAVKTTLCGFSSRMDALAERLDRQAEAVRSMYAAYSQRETELEQLVDGLARLRAFPTPLASSAL
jgi:chromosome segregation ATPase